MENGATLVRFRSDRVAFLRELSEPVVITWGFHPVHDTQDILFLKEAGFRLVWLDGNRPAALREFIRRGTVQESLFYLQLWNMESTQVVKVVTPEVLASPFDSGGRFKRIDDLAAEILRAFQ
jgi:hypothetical protein